MVVGSIKESKPHGYGEHEGAPAPGSIRSLRTRRGRSPHTRRWCPTLDIRVSHETHTNETEELWPFPS